ncbi:hypothetical protein [Collimonas sp.]|uniref:hypothetical protein n=1 Tax=Collimonas sp. TaxID=1963772 RepID=UPI0037BEB8D1
MQRCNFVGASAARYIAYKYAGATRLLAESANLPDNQGDHPSNCRRAFMQCQG